MSFTVLACPGGYNKIPDWWLVNNGFFFLIVLKAGKSQIIAPADSVFGKSWLSYNLTWQK